MIQLHDVEPVWQGGRPHGQMHLPNGGPSCGACGCVACTMRTLRMALRPDLQLWSVADVLDHLANTPGAFVDSQGRMDVAGAWLLNVPVAAQAMGLRAGSAVAHAANHDDAQHEWMGGHLVDANVDLAETLAGIIADDGGAAVRVDVDGDGLGDHTIACVGRTGTGFVCACSAIDDLVVLDANLEAPGVKWNGRPYPYRAVGVRGVWSEVSASSR